jgi:hypothetical protein
LHTFQLHWQVKIFFSSHPWIFLNVWLTLFHVGWYCQNCSQMHFLMSHQINLMLNQIYISLMGWNG